LGLETMAMPRHWVCCLTSSGSLIRNKISRDKLRRRSRVRVASVLDMRLLAWHGTLEHEL
jgi:hypothetical protein